MEKTKRVQWLCGSKTYSPQKKIFAAGDTLIPHFSLLIPHYKKIFVDMKRKIRYNKRERNVRKIL